MLLSYPFIVRLFPFMSLRLDILLVFYFDGFDHWCIIKDKSLEINTKSSALDQYFDVLNNI